MTTPTVSDLLHGDLRHDGSGARARSAAFAGSHEDHVGTGERIADVGTRLLRGLGADLGVRPGTEPARELLADMDRAVGIGHEQSLTVRVDGDELDALDAGLDHAVDGVRSAAANADDLDHSQVVGSCVFGHVSPSYV